MSLLDQFVEEVNKLSVTPPVFKITTNHGGWQGTQLVLEPMNKINHHDDVTDELWETDPIKAMAMSCSRETIDSNTKGYHVSSESSLYNLKSTLRSKVLNFLGSDHNRESEMYQWYDRYATQENAMKSRYMETFLGIVKYILSSTRNYTLDAKHRQNALGLLELIYQRDFKPEHVPQPQRRRRRRK